MNRVALYRHFDMFGKLLYVGVSEDPTRRFAEHRANSEWMSLATRTTIIWMPDRVAAIKSETNAILTESPVHNKRSGSYGDISDLINSFGQRSDFAEAVGVKLGAVHKWAANGRIPSKWQMAVVKAAKKAGKKEITSEWMLNAHAVNVE